jgi:hypothetical protein
VKRVLGLSSGDLTISAESDAIIAKVQVLLNGDLVAERPAIDIHSTQQIFAEIDDDPIQNRTSLRFYSLIDGWWRSRGDCGSLTDKYGNSIDLGFIGVGIIEAQPDFGMMS